MQSLKIKNGNGKLILKDILSKYIDPTNFLRPKQGFGIPLGEWLKGPLKDWSEDLLNKSKLENEGFFNQTLVRASWKEHLEGKRNWEHSLWNVLMFQAWLDNVQ